MSAHLNSRPPLAQAPNISSLRTSLGWGSLWSQFVGSGFNRTGCVFVCYAGYALVSLLPLPQTPFLTLIINHICLDGSGSPSYSAVSVATARAFSFLCFYPIPGRGGVRSPEASLSYPPTLERSRLQASSIPSSRESLCLPENRRTEHWAPGDLHYSGPPNKGIKVCPEASVRYPLSGYDSPMESSSFK